MSDIQKQARESLQNMFERLQNIDGMFDWTAEYHDVVQALDSDAVKDVVQQDL